LLTRVATKKLPPEYLSQSWSALGEKDAAAKNAHLADVGTPVSLCMGRKTERSLKGVGSVTDGAMGCLQRRNTKRCRGGGRCAADLRGGTRFTEFVSAKKRKRGHGHSKKNRHER